MKHGSEIIRSIRLSQELSIRQISEVTGITKLDLSRIERNRLKPDANMIKKLSEAYKYDENKLKMAFDVIKSNKVKNDLPAFICKPYNRGKK